MNTFRGLILALLAAAVLTSAVLAQNIVTGGISGTVSDPTGAVVSGAKVTLTSKSTGEKQAGTTSSSGLYGFPLLKPGPYAVLVEQSGFRAVSTTVEVELGQTATVNVKLEVGSATGTVVEVSGQAPLLQTEDANITTTITQAQIDNLPNPGGDITSYAQTAPGVMMNTQSGFGYGNFSAFGLPATSNLFTLNGNDENDPFLNLNNSGSSNLLLGQNEIQEVAVVSNGYTAQYGRQAGVQIDYATKSGSNALHGDLAFWYNSSGLNANEWFQKAFEIAGGTKNQQPFAVAHQWAGSVGGPIKKDKLFFYVDQEGLRYALPSTGQVYFPTAAFATAVLNNISTNQPAQLPYYTSLMNLYQNAPNYSKATPITIAQDSSGNFGCGDFAGTLGFGTASTPCSQLLSTSGVNHNKEWLLTTRLDYNISTADKIFGRVKVDHGSQPTSTDLIDPKVFSTQSIQPEWEGQINETHIFSPNVVNNFVVSGLWYSAVFLPDSGQQAVISTLGMSTLQFTSSNTGGVLSSLGGTSTPDYFFPQGRKSTLAQVSDDFSVTRGNHTFKMGLNFRRDDLSDFDNQVVGGGFANFSSLTDFYNGAPSIFNGDYFFQTFTQNKEAPIAYYSVGLYFQDEYRVKRNLKVTVALRGDRNSNATCRNNCYARLVSPFSLLSHDATIPYNQAILTNQHSAFPEMEKVALQPRLGVTWSPGGHSNTVLRGGVGVFSDLYQGVLLDSLIGNSPLTNSFIVFPGLSGPTPLAPSVAGSVVQDAAGSNASFLGAFASGGTFGSISAANPAFSAPGMFSVANHINNPKYLEWNFEIQQAIGSKMSVDLNYVGTHGYDILVQNPGLNAYNTGASSFGSLPATIPDIRFGTVDELSSVGRSNFHGLVSSWTVRNTHGFQASVNYTYSHALDNVTSTNPGTPYSLFTSVVRQVDPFSVNHLSYGNSDSDAHHNLTANYVWTMPFKFHNRMMDDVVGGWGLGGTLFYHSGVPYSVVTSEPQILNENGTFLASFNGGAVGDCNSPGNIIVSPHQCLTASQFAAPGDGGQSGFGNVARNSFRGPHYFDTDLTVMKNFAFTERTKFQLAGNFYNVLNHPNFFQPSNNVASGNFGQLYVTAVPPTTPYGAYQGAGVSGRVLQLQGKFIF